MEQVKNQIYINELNEKDNENIMELVKKYFSLKEEKERIEQAMELVVDKLDETNYQIIAIDKFNLRLAITPKKQVDKINYEATMSGIDNVDDFKKVYQMKKWDDDKIKQQLNVVYEKEVVKPKIRITTLEK